ncbi:hypothetical protein Taro_056805 [Colocasia esculenta]|uniref:Uncharacterized protein n=1 Tax=Colocasia esculenta TaxID=4460 RepID=A0A843XYH5_COLES|nr:hypothetical protein [Colocasia esculenta]
MISLARLWPVRGRQTRIKYITGLTGLDEVFHHSWYQSKVRVNIRELERYIALFRSLKWLIEEIEVVEEMIQRRVLSV